MKSHSKKEGGNDGSGGCDDRNSAGHYERGSFNVNTSINVTHSGPDVNGVSVIVVNRVAILLKVDDGLSFDIVCDQVSVPTFEGVSGISQVDRCTRNWKRSSDTSSGVGFKGVSGAELNLSTLFSIIGEANTVN